MTLLTWMVYATIVAALLGTAAWMLERATLPLGRPARWIWALALVGAVGIPLVALWGSGRGGSEPGQEAGPLGRPVTSLLPGELHGARSSTGALPALPRVGDWLAAGIRRVAETPPASLLSDRLLAVLWAAGASTLLLIAGMSSLLLGHRVRRWPSVRLRGRDRVRITPGLGPAVVGLVRPWIVLPPWTLEVDPRHLEFILRHEEEHVSARDTLVLAAGAMAVLALFWNPVLWWLLGRLRSAVEMDCDGRVLARGVPPGEYGALLLEVVSRGTPLPLHMAALAEPSNLLERRIRQMKPSRVRHPVLGLAAAGMTAVLLTLVACDTRVPAPTAATEADPITVPAEEGLLHVAGPEGGLLADSPMLHGPEEEDGRWHLISPEGRISGDRLVLQGPVVMERRQDDAVSTQSPLIVVDGVILGGGTLDEHQLKAVDIASIEVVKGAAATARFGERALHGVILITTKNATGGGGA